MTTKMLLEIDRLCDACTPVPVIASTVGCSKKNGLYPHAGDRAESKAHPPESRVPGDAYQNGQDRGRDHGGVRGTARGEKSDA